MSTLTLAEGPDAVPVEERRDDRAFGGPTASSWREQALTRIAELEDLVDAFRLPDNPSSGPPLGARGELLAARIHRHLDTARDAAGADRRRPWTKFWAMLGGSPLERTASNMDAAEMDLLRVAPIEYVHGQLPSLLAAARSHLKPDDPRRKQLEAVCSGQRAQLTETERNVVIATARATASAARREMVQIRSFRNILYMASALLTVAALVLVVIGATTPRVLPLCFTPGEAVVCPTGVGPATDQADAGSRDTLMRETAQPWDVPLIALLGLVAAAVSSAVALRNLRGTTTPYALPVALAVLKLPTGVLTAVLGLLLMRGEFVPGLSALDSPGQVLAWAVLFGYAQQLFTRFVDDRAHNVLDQVGGQGPDRRTTSSVVTRTASTGSVDGDVPPEGDRTPV